MRQNWLQRTELLIKKQGVRLSDAYLLVVGLGGIGSFAVEFLARTVVGKITIVDGDIIDITSVNRQLPALNSTVERFKVDVVAERLLDINPDLILHSISEFLSPERMEELLKENKFDYVLDCIDSLSPKISLIYSCKKNKIKIISAMGAGGKMDPSKVMVRDISKTNNCFLARQMRKRLKKENVRNGVRCVFSSELQDENSLSLMDGTNFKKSYYGTISYMPAIFGLYSASSY